MAVIKLKTGIKGVVRKETLAAENPVSVTISSDLLPLRLPPYPARSSICV